MCMSVYSNMDVIMASCMRGTAIYLYSFVCVSNYIRICFCRYYALRQLRIEKFFVYWGQDIFPNVTPLECGRAFRVDFKVITCFAKF